MDSSEKSASYIFSILTDTEEIQQLYETSDGKIINSLVGVDNFLYWVEYAREIQVDTPWEIKSLDTNNNEVQTFREGISEDQILPSVLRVFGNQLTWIEYQIDKDVVTSAAMRYDPKSKEMMETGKVELDENDKKIEMVSS